MNKLFSVLIASYNNGKFLDECIESITSQSYSNWEIIIVDDASTDESLQVLSKYEHLDKIKVFRNKKNMGCGYTKRKCVELARGEICGFVDPDDVLTNDALELMVKCHVENPEHSLIYSTHYLCDEQLQVVKIPDYVGQIPPPSKSWHLIRPVIAHFATFKRSKYQETEGISASLKKAVDKDLYYKLEDTGPVLFVDKPLYYYRQHKNSISLNTNSGMAAKFKMAAIVAAMGRNQCDDSIFSGIQYKKSDLADALYQVSQYEMKHGRTKEALGFLFTLFRFAPLYLVRYVISSLILLPVNLGFVVLLNTLESFVALLGLSRTNRKRIKDKLTKFSLDVRYWAQSVLVTAYGWPKSHLIAASVVILLGFAVKVFYLITMPISYDEAMTYLFFTKKGIWTSMTKYPAPNNHILHSILTNITYYFPFSQTVNLRLPNLLVNTLSGVILFYTFSKLLNSKIALFLLAGYSFLFPVLYYGYCSRGYSLVFLAFIICFYAAVQLIQTESYNITFKKYLILLSGGAIVGFYTMPSFLYPYITSVSFLFLVFALKREWNKILALTVSGACVAFVVLLLYLPVLRFSGLDAVVNNRFVRPIPRTAVLKSIPDHFSFSFSFLFDQTLLNGLLAISLIAIYLGYHKFRRPTVLFTVYCFAFAPILLLIHSVVPFARTWVYLIVPFLFLAGSGLQKVGIHEKIGIKTWLILTACLIVLLSVRFNSKVMKKEAFEFNAQKTAELLINSQADTVYINHNLIKINILYIFEEKKKKLVTINSNQENIRMDTLLTRRCYDFLITRTKIDSIYGYPYFKQMGEKIHLNKRD